MQEARSTDLDELARAILTKTLRTCSLLQDSSEDKDKYDKTSIEELARNV